MGTDTFVQPLIAALVNNSQAVATAEAYRMQQKEMFDRMQSKLDSIGNDVRDLKTVQEQLKQMRAQVEDHEKRLRDNQPLVDQMGKHEKMIAEIDAKVDANQLQIARWLGIGGTLFTVLNIALSIGIIPW